MTTSKRRVVGVLMGGASRERDVSLNTGKAFSRTLDAAGFECRTIDWRPGKVRELLDAQIDVALLALHGGYGEGGTVQGLLNAAGIPYTGSGVLASALAMDKVRSKQLFRDAGLATPDFQVVSRRDLDAALAAGSFAPALSLPYVIKPSREGSSVGITIFDDAEGPEPSAESLLTALEAAKHHDDEVLVESFIAGKELSVGVFDDQVMGTVEIVPADGFYSYEAKYLSKTTEYLIPPPISAAARTAVEALAHRAYRALDCRGVARVDVMLDVDERPWLLELNTLPGMTETSLVPKLAQARGESFGALVTRMLDAARVDDA